MRIDGYGHMRSPQLRGMESRSLAGSESRTERSRADTVELSANAGSHHGPDEMPVRRELVEKVRARLEAGAYQQPVLIERVVDRMLDALGF